MEKKKEIIDKIMTGIYYCFNGEGLISSGKRISDLALMTIAIQYLLISYIKMPNEIKSNHIFTTLFMLGVALIPIYFCFIYLKDILKIFGEHK